MRRREFLLAAGGLLAGGAAAQCYIPLRGAWQAEPEGDEPLAVRARRRGLVYGAAVQAATLRQDPAFAALVARECGLLVPENELKWSTLRPARDAFDFSAADQLADFARVHGLQLRGHPLVWHEQLPDWFAREVHRGNAERVMRDHVAAVMGRYAGVTHSWDVVNEAIEPRDGRPDGMRRTPWLELLGEGYLDLAFHAAAEAAPAALLFYNDHWMENDDRGSARRRRAVLRMLEGMVRRGVPVYGLGIQAHLHATGQRLAPRRVLEMVDEVTALGLRVLITELDVNDAGLPAHAAARDRAVAAVYGDFVGPLLARPAVMGVVTWGLSDRHSWLAGRRAHPAGARPLPFDAQLRRKPAWSALAAALDAAPPR